MFAAINPFTAKYLNVYELVSHDLGHPLIFLFTNVWGNIKGRPRSWLNGSYAVLSAEYLNK